MTGRGKILFLEIAAIAVIGGFFAWFSPLNNEKKSEEPIVCTQDAKLCPDGSYVGRTAPKCEFALCPSEALCEGGPCPDVEPSVKDGNDSTRKKLGAVAGRVTIGPLCPVEPCQSPLSNPYSSRQIMLEPQDGRSSPIYIQIDSDGKFRGEVPFGIYKATITDCDFLGCKYTAPKTVVVESGKTAELNINIDTGIR